MLSANQQFCLYLALANQSVLKTIETYVRAGHGAFQVKMIIFSNVMGYPKFLPWAFSNFPLIIAI